MKYKTYQEASEERLKKQIDDATTYKEKKTEYEKKEHEKKVNEYFRQLASGEIK